MPSVVKAPTSATRVMAARTALVLDEPFFGTLALRLKLVEDPTCKTAWVDGQSLGYNPVFIETLSQDQLKAVLIHEVMHCANGHPWRRQARDFKEWNEACDRAINPTIRESGYRLPDDALFELDPSHEGKSAEWIFDRLPRPVAPQQSQGGGQGASGQGKPSEEESESGAGQGGSGQKESGKKDKQDNQQQGNSGQQEQEEPNGQDPADQDGGADAAPSKTGEVRDAPSGGGAGDDDAAPTEADWQMAVQQAAAIAKGQGNLSAGMARFVEQATKPRVDWRSALRRFAQEISRSDYRWSRPNMRYAPRGLYLPALRGEEVGVIAVAVDTSGSIDQVLLAQFASELQAIADEVHPRQIRVLYADARVQREDVFEKYDPIELHAKGGGGTDFCPVFERIEEWEEPPMCVIYLTDLWGTFPVHAPEMPVLWVTPGEPARTVPFGEIVATS